MLRLTVIGIAIFGVCSVVIRQAEQVETSKLPTYSQQEQLLQIKLYSDNIAESLEAAWGRVLAKLRSDAVNHPVGSRYIVSQETIQRFLGFVEGRLQVVLPGAFSETLKDTEIWWTGQVHFPVYNHSIVAKSRNAELRHRMLPTMSVVREGDAVRVIVATGNFPSMGLDGSVLLPSELSKLVTTDTDTDTDTDTEEVLEDEKLPISSALFTPEYVLIALVDDDRPGGKLIRLDKIGNKVRWSKEMSEYAGDSYRGGATWFTEIRAGREQIVLFHTSETAFGIEGFGIDGELLFQFSSLLPVRRGQE